MENLQPVHQTNKQTNPRMFRSRIGKQPVSTEISATRGEAGAMCQNKGISEDF